ncbi:MotA/TolQ/ExbB proton channel family protein [Campylobacter geochelonis]|uniref:MotA/TolQ/ExbB proton channel family protein n=1 Tax=Campylobacter geochelonis TaxID=1780362 RepID=UPI0007708579|nr:MotA/TolQ/ExbB proton channel family protein [Campylobacter geochelonis]CZE48404.1 membrane protein [Campylobacter geochelonis]
MENKNDSVLDIALPENSNRSLFGVYVKIVAVPVLIYLVFLAGYFKIIDFKVEFHSIAMMGFLLVLALIFARHSAEYGCCLFEDRIVKFKSGLKEYIMSHLMVVGNRKKSNASFDGFIDEYTRDMRNDNYASVAAGVFPMLGILGTFISIAISMPAFSSSDINSLESEIAQLLGGVGTAFYVSIFGIFLALWWIYFEKKGLSRYQKLVFKYKNATKNFFWDKDEISQNLMQELISKNEKVANIFETSLNSEFSKNLSRAMIEKFDAFKSMIDLEKESFSLSLAQIEKTNEFLSNASKITQELNQRYENTIVFMDNLINNTNLVYQKLSKHLENSALSSAQNYSKIEEVVSNLVIELRGLENSLKETNLDILKNQNVAMENFKTSIAQGLGEFKSAFKEEIVASTDNSDVIEELRRSLASIDKESKDIIKTIEKTKNEN